MSDGRYTIHVEVDGRSLGTKKIHDPFITSETVIGRRDLFRAWIRGNLSVRTVVHADRAMIYAVMQLSRFMEGEDT